MHVGGSLHGMCVEYVAGELAVKPPWKGRVNEPIGVHQWCWQESSRVHWSFAPPSSSLSSFFTLQPYLPSLSDPRNASSPLPISYTPHRLVLTSILAMAVNTFPFSDPFGNEEVKAGGVSQFALFSSPHGCWEEHCQKAIQRVYVFGREEDKGRGDRAITGDVGSHSLAPAHIGGHVISSIWVEESKNFSIKAHSHQARKLRIHSFLHPQSTAVFHGLKHQPYSRFVYLLGLLSPEEESTMSVFTELYISPVTAGVV